MNTRPLVLLTNDDGCNSPGLLAAAGELITVGELLIVAPLDQQSGMGRSWPDTPGTMHRLEIPINGFSHPVYALEGTPAQAVGHGILRIAPRRPALAVSGINYGQNLGLVVTSSGTVGAAIEAAVAGIPSLAVSLETDQAHFHSYSEEVDFTAAARVTARIARWVLEHGLPAGVDLLKIDLPSDATIETPLQLTRLSRRRYFVAKPMKTAALGQPVRLDYSIDPTTSLPGTDTYALAYDRHVAVTPLTVDLSVPARIEEFPGLHLRGDSDDSQAA